MQAWGKSMVVWVALPPSPPGAQDAAAGDAAAAASHAAAFESAFLCLRRWTDPAADHPLLQARIQGQGCGALGNYLRRRGGAGGVRGSGAWVQSNRSHGGAPCPAAGAARGCGGAAGGGIQGPGQGEGVGWGALVFFGGWGSCCRPCYCPCHCPCCRALPRVRPLQPLPSAPQLAAPLEGAPSRQALELRASLLQRLGWAHWAASATRRLVATFPHAWPPI